MLYVAWQGQEALLDAQLAALQATGSDVQRIDAGAALARVPVLQPAGLIGAIAEPGAMDIDVHALHQQAAARRARALGASLWADAELEAARHGGRGLDAGRGRRPQRASPRAGQRRRRLGRHGGATRRRWRRWALQPQRRSAFTFDAPAATTTAAGRRWCGIDEGWYFKPDAGQLLGSPANADPVPAHDVRGRGDRHRHRHRAHRGAHHAHHPPPAAHLGRAAHLRARRRTRDRQRSARARGFFWLAGQGGYGIQSAAGAALLAESLLLGAALPERLREQGVQAGGDVAGAAAVTARPA